MNELTEKEKDFLSRCLLYAGVDIGSSAFSLVASIAKKLSLDFNIVAIGVHVIADTGIEKSETLYRESTRKEVKVMFSKEYRKNSDCYPVENGHLSFKAMGRALLKAREFWGLRDQQEVVTDIAEGVDENDYIGWVIQELCNLTGARVRSI